MVELAEAGGHFAAAGAGGGDDHEAAGSFDVVVAAEAVVGDDEGNVGGVVGDDVVAVDLDAEGFEPVLELVGDGLAAVVCEDDTADVEADAAECVDQAEGVVVVGDAEVAAALAALDVVGGDGDDDLGLVLHFEQHFHLAVGREAGEDAGGVVIVEELAAEFEIQLAAEFADAVADVL